MSAGPATRKGRCLCGSVQFQVSGEPLRAHASHCTFCQRRTGSAFAEVAYYSERDITVDGPALSSYTHRSDESGRWLKLEFCANCGTCLFITLERRPGERGIHIGTLDDPRSLKIVRHIWCISRQGNTPIPRAAQRRDKGLTQADLAS